MATASFDVRPWARVRGTLALGSVAGLSARVLAFWFGSLGLVNVIATLRHPAFDPNIWWLDLRFLPKVGGQLLLMTVGALLLAHGVRPVTGGWRRQASLAAVAVTVLFASMNAVAYYRIWDAGTIEPRSPVPLSFVIAVLLASIWISMIRPVASVDRRTSLEVVAAMSLAFVIGLPLLQMVFFGTTDYRRPADVVVVFGARVRNDGTPSLTLANRVTTASELYRDGLVDTVVMTGGVEPSGIDETIVMRDLAMQLGVPSGAIVRDADGLNTNASVANTIRILRDRGLHRILAVSQFYHLPRIKLAYTRAGVDAWTVPARTSITRTGAIVAREIPAFWLYYLRAVAA